MGTISGQTAVFAVLGHPIAHSLSPKIHQALFDAMHVDATYIALAPLKLKSHAIPDMLRDLGIRGANITKPFKCIVAASPAVEPDDDVRILGAANTLVVKDNLEIRAYNTDVSGFIASVPAPYVHGLRGQSAAVIGAGGAARAVILALSKMGISHIILINRTLDRAVKLASELSPHLPQLRFDTKALHASVLQQTLPHCAIIVNAASARIKALDTHRFTQHLPHAIFIDLNYWMADPPGFVAAKDAGLYCQDGFEMLLCQAAAATPHFIDNHPSPQVMALARAVLHQSMHTPSGLDHERR